MNSNFLVRYHREWRIVFLPSVPLITRHVKGPTCLTYFARVGVPVPHLNLPAYW